MKQPRLGSRRAKKTKLMPLARKGRAMGRTFSDLGNALAWSIMAT